MKHLEHSPAYVAQIGQSWRVVVPIRGRLSAKICSPEFSTQIGAIAWLQSEEGQQEVARTRAARRGAAARGANGPSAPHQELALPA
jgi:hypothetical protein